MGRSIDTAGPPHPGAASPAEDRRARGFGWRRLQVVASLGAISSFLVPMVITLSFEPFLLATLAPFVIGLLVMLRWPPVASIWLGVASLGVLLTSAPFLVEALAHPESLADFLPLVAFTLSTLVGGGSSSRRTSSSLRGASALSAESSRCTSPTGTTPVTHSRSMSSGST